MLAKTVTYNSQNYAGTLGSGLLDWLQEKGQSVLKALYNKKLVGLKVWQVC